MLAQCYFLLNSILCINMKGTHIYRVAQYGYLGATIAEDLSWHANTDRLASKAMTRLSHFRKNARIPCQSAAHCLQVLPQHYRKCSAVRDYCVRVTSQKVKTKTPTGRIGGRSLPIREVLGCKKTLQLGLKIHSDTSHPLNASFTLAFHWLRQAKVRTMRFRNMFPN